MEDNKLKESKLFTPYKLGNITLRNRTIRSAAFESMGDKFGPTQQLKDYHVSVAKGGIGMTTLAYAAVCRSGLSFDKQLWLRPEIVPGLKDITDAVHQAGAAASIQIGHCGNMTHYSTAGQIPIGPSTGINMYAYTPVRRMRKDEIAQVAKDFGRAIHTAHEAGFDCVEVHAGHGYLISQFLSPYTNHRRDEFGGSLDNRMRFMRMCMDEVMEAAAKTGTSILVKHNMEDGFKSGIQIPESIEIAKVIESYGVDGIVLSSGFVSKAPMAVMRGLIPIYTMSYYMPLWLRYFVRWFGPMMIQQFPFEETFFYENAMKFRKELKCPLVYVGGLVSREGIDKVLDSGFEMVQMGRALVSEPDFVNRLAAEGAGCRSRCDHKNYCIARMYSVDMQCCHNCNLEKLPKRVRKELGL
jgi:2,4-dienoyl-CoA reductase-like NADH-dependent reductase (Old Yellow Enzyme family)